MFETNREKTFYFRIGTPDGLTYYVKALININIFNKMYPWRAFLPLDKSSSVEIQNFVLDELKNMLTKKTPENVDDLSIHFINHSEFKKNANSQLLLGESL